MIYRFLSKLATLDRLQAFPVPVPGRNIKFHEPSYEKYEAKSKELTISMSYPGVGVYEAPTYSQVDGLERGMCMRFMPGADNRTDLPDIWGVHRRIIVSEKVKLVIEASDTMVHEFIPFYWIDHEENQIQTERKYFWMNQRRFLRIKPGERMADPKELGFFPVDVEEDFGARAIDTPSLFEWLTQFPIWQHCGTEGVVRSQSPIKNVVYFSEKMFCALKEAAVTGLELYSTWFGEREESVCAIGLGGFDLGARQDSCRLNHAMLTDFSTGK